MLLGWRRGEGGGGEIVAGMHQLLYARQVGLVVLSRYEDLFNSKQFGASHRDIFI